MKKWLKRIRGAVGMGLTWATAWFGASMIFLLVPLLVFGYPPVGVGPAQVLYGSVLFARLGFAGGAAFSIVLSVSEGRRRFDEMSLWRFAFWGALGGVLMSWLLIGTGTETVDSIVTYGIIPLLAAGSAAGSLALARRADDRELLEHGADVADIGLTEEEKRELLAG